MQVRDIQGEPASQLNKLMEEPTTYEKLGLARLLEMREECWREFSFFYAYISINQRYLCLNNARNTFVNTFFSITGFIIR
ncbi:hypothetical protein AAZX31_15G246300 [Glycine max]